MLLMTFYKNESLLGPKHLVYRRNLDYKETFIHRQIVRNVISVINIAVFFWSLQQSCFIPN